MCFLRGKIKTPFGLLSSNAPIKRTARVLTGRSMRSGMALNGEVFSY